MVLNKSKIAHTKFKEIEFLINTKYDIVKCWWVEFVSEAPQSIYKVKPLTGKLFNALPTVNIICEWNSLCLHRTLNCTRRLSPSILMINRVFVFVSHWAKCSMTQFALKNICVAFINGLVAHQTLISSFLVKLIYIYSHKLNNLPWKKLIEKLADGKNVDLKRNAKKSFFLRKLFSNLFKYFIFIRKDISIKYS